MQVQMMMQILTVLPTACVELFIVASLRRLAAPQSSTLPSRVRSFIAWNHTLERLI
jgi:hypothetical protein